MTSQLIVSERGRLGLVQALPPGGGGWGLCGWVDIQVTECVNVKNKISDAERMGMWDRPSHWHEITQ